MQGSRQSDPQAESERTRRWLASNTPVEVDLENTNDTSAGFSCNDEDLRGLIGSDNVTHSRLESRFENGRRYHAAEAIYHIPNDDPEQERLNLQGEIFKRELNGNLFIAPLVKERIRRVLDVGCGTGRWCIEAANALPHASVEGVDISLYQPTEVPSNCSFHIQDVNTEWKLDHKYDLIHMRAMVFPVDDWPRVLEQAYNALAPGGYLELHEANPAIEEKDADPDAKPSLFAQFGRGVTEACIKLNRDPVVIATIGSLMKDRGFVDVTYEPRYLPIGTWPKGRKYKEIGSLMARNMSEATKSAAGIFTRVLGTEQAEYDAFAAKVRTEISSGKYHMQMRIFIGVGQKPTTDGA